MIKIRCGHQVNVVSKVVDLLEHKLVQGRLDYKSFVWIVRQAPELDLVLFIHYLYMAPNDRRKQKISSKEESSYVEPWQELPETLLNFLKKGRLSRKRGSTAQSIGSAGVSKSWRCASKKCDSIAQSPWLELSNEPQCYCKTQQHTFDSSFVEGGGYWWHGRSRPRYDPWKHLHYNSPWFFVTGKMIHINNVHWAIHSSQIKRSLLLSYSPYCGGCSCFPPFAVYALGQNQKRMKHESSQNGIIDPNDPKKQLIQFCNAIIFEGKFYALSLQGTLAVIEEIEHQFQVTRLSKRRAIPSSYSKHLIEYFLESNGEILLIFLISERSNRMVNKVEVFKLQIESLSWLKLDNLRDRTLFAGINCCMSVPASQAGSRNNCVYFTHHAIDGWRLYEMESGCIFHCYDEAGSEIKSSVWEKAIFKNHYVNHETYVSTCFFWQ
ncbi:uncharacterized protein LOC132598756 [Lycium barbarum]|uniref:uncharacterized protein LOC132598756 n=1 Tax=Lycium barbarum TaxID=112863 RepID=UPI00293F1AFB|nr:uncharacterized protein LOC132598756 [Lycium barbarum]XP_060167807.1 uncharacterized protein LOC132598756 [Lycium barbarum]XP_060167808.1 uncharacterized protein LOC132598756 [Lycium barbarum]